MTDIPLQETFFLIGWGSSELTEQETGYRCLVNSRGGACSPQYGHPGRNLAWKVLADVGKPLEESIEIHAMKTTRELLQWHRILWVMLGPNTLIHAITFFAKECRTKRSF